MPDNDPISPSEEDALHLSTKLKGRIALVPDLHARRELLRDASLYKFVWVRSGRLRLSVDHVETVLEPNEVLTLTPFHRLSVTEAEGEYAALVFNSNFYCIFGHDAEVSCNGFLFNGGPRLVRLRLRAGEAAALEELRASLLLEAGQRDDLQEEMLRILLKRFIILCTRIARQGLNPAPGYENAFDTVRQYLVLVDRHFREKKKVQDYADLLHRSPKTLSNLFSAYKLPSPLRVIHERTEAEARRLLLHTSRSAKEIALLLGFEDPAAFSRFFKHMTGESPNGYRRNQKAKHPQAG